MGGWVDSHSHLFMADDPGTLLDRAERAGVDWVLIPGIDLETSIEARKLAATYPKRVLWSAGLHPHAATRWEVERDGLTALIVEAAAVGECGLDYYRHLSPLKAQYSAFKAQLEIAADLDKPVIVHTRDSFTDVWAALSEAALGEKAVLHCWTGGPRWTRRFDELGATFSFAGPITFKTGDTVRRGAAVAPPERTIVETDTPYLTPPPDRGLPNEPANVVRVGQALAEVWGVGLDEVARLSTGTVTRVFGKPAV